MVVSSGTTVNILPQTALSLADPQVLAVLPVVPPIFLETRFINAPIPVKGSWKLTSNLMVLIRNEEEFFVAAVPALDEYGLGPSAEAALDDLLSSLVDYMESLLRREARLSQQLARDLEMLKRLLTK